MTRTKTPVIDRLLSKVVENSDGCWIFTGAIASTGYGSIGLGGRGEGNASTHVVTYEFFIGEILEGLELDHLCRVRACCNPWHMDQVTRAVNMERGTRWSKTHCHRGHEFSKTGYYYRQSGKRECKACVRARNSAAYYQRKL